MAIVGLRSLSRSTSVVMRDLRESGEPVVVTDHGHPIALLTPLTREQAPAIALAYAPELVAQREQADRDFAEGLGTPAGDLLAEFAREDAAVAQEDATGPASDAFASSAASSGGSSARTLLTREETGEIARTIARAIARQSGGEAGSRLPEAPREWALARSPSGARVLLAAELGTAVGEALLELTLAALGAEPIRRAAGITEEVSVSFAEVIDADDQASARVLRHLFADVTTETRYPQH